MGIRVPSVGGGVLTRGDSIGCLLDLWGASVSKDPQTSLKRRRASQQNGKLGGVKTLEGKVKSSKNANKHSLLSTTLTGYDKVSTNRLKAELIEEFRPNGRSEIFLIEILSVAYVKLGRCYTFETEILREALTAERGFNFDEHLKNTLEDKIVPDELKARLQEDTFKKWNLF